jgi:type 1 glutamine amidotransferase
MSRTFFFVFSLALLTLFSFVRADPADTQPGAAPPDPAKIKLLIITGGHPYPKTFFNQFDDNHDIVYTSAVEGDFKKGTASAYDRPDLLTYDAILLYDFQLNITPDEQKNFHAIFDKGIGVICLHHALLSYQGWPDYEHAVGGLYLLDFKKYADKVWPESTYKGDTDMDVIVVDKTHPITAGISDFHMKDEIYRGVHHTDDIHTVLTCEGNPLVWTRDENNSHVVTLLIGHGPGTWDNPSFQKLLRNSLHWVARK